MGASVWNNGFSDPKVRRHQGGAARGLRRQPHRAGEGAGSRRRLQLGIEELRRWGVEVRERSGGPARDVLIGAVAQDPYESGRPPPEVACRVGDERFLALRGAHERARDAKEGDPT